MSLRIFLQHISQPEYRHILLNPWPIYGTAAGVFVLIGSLMAKSAAAQKAGLGLIAFSCLMIFPVVHYGEKAYDHIWAVSRADAQEWLDTHEKRAEKSEPVYYLTAVLSLAAIFWRPQRDAIRRGLLAATLISALVTLLLGRWIAQAGGQVRHPEFRSQPPSSEDVQGLS